MNKNSFIFPFPPFSLSKQTLNQVNFKLKRKKQNNELTVRSIKVQKTFQQLKISFLDDLFELSDSLATLSLTGMSCRLPSLPNPDHSFSMSRIHRVRSV